MPYSKSRKVDIIPTERLSGTCLSIIEEMLSIIVNRTVLDYPEQNFYHAPGNLRYFGVGHQLKVSKLGDTLYSAMKDVLIYVMGELAKESDTDIKFQVPKHTSFVGTIVKNVGIEVIAKNESYRQYVHSLTVSQGKYPFDVNSEIFQSIYKDTVLRLEERGFLFEDDPELYYIRHLDKSLSPVDGPLQQGDSMNPIAITNEDIIPQNTYSSISEKMNDDDSANEDEYGLNELEILKSPSRKRIILPYLRRLVETKKSAAVTQKRIETLSDVVEPDEEIKQVFNEKYNEILNMSRDDMSSSTDMLKGHCIYSTLAYLKEHFSKERVDIMEQYLKNEKSAPPKARKRYVKVPSSKRIHYMDNTQVYPLTNDPANPEGLLPLI